VENKGKLILYGREYNYFIIIIIIIITIVCANVYSSILWHLSTALLRLEAIV
jgi:hypothetical protein